MTPYEQVKRLYDENPVEGTFHDYLHTHMMRGFVYVTPSYFVMGRGVDKDAPQEEVTDCTVEFTRERQNCWFVHAMAGDIRQAIEVMPYQLGHIGFVRLAAGRSELAIYRTEDLRRRTAITQP